jgi:ATP-binding cassette, subfamily F, member 3
MPTTDVILRFNNVSFEYGRKPILNEADFSVREGSKITLMGQNGAGKSTIFRMIMGAAGSAVRANGAGRGGNTGGGSGGSADGLKIESGAINIDKDTTIATARQVIPRDELALTVREFFEAAFPGRKMYDIEPRIKKILEVVHLAVALDKPLKGLSGGQQARVLLAQALIQDPDILLLDEPTNNLDKQGIAHLTQFLIDYKKTVIVISHDADFLNSFTHGVLYLDVFTHKVEQYTGDYLKVVEDIKARLERERMLNVRLQRDIQHRKDQANFFAQKGGHMRDVARKMNEKIDDLEGEIVEARQEDKTIRQFAISVQEDITGIIVELDSVSLMNLKTHKPVAKKLTGDKLVRLKKRERLLLAGPNGIGKTTLLETLATGHATGEHIAKGVRIGYYRQDFSTLDFDETVYKTLADGADIGASSSGNGGAGGRGGSGAFGITEQELRSTAAGFLLDAEILKTKIGALSEGQKGLVAFARLSLERPGLLILDEPTNHINFRHIPIIAKALDRYEGAMILVSHVPEFVKQIKIDQTLDLESL